MAHYCIGDVQGCFTELITLLTKINFNPKYDRVWFVGDLVNRGPDSLNTLRYIKSLGDCAVVVLGNHDLHLLAVAAGKAKLKSQDTIQAILTATDCTELCHWLQQQKLIHHDKQLGYTLVHAGIPPQWNLNKALACAQEVETVLRSDKAIDFFENMYGNIPNQWHEKLVGWERLRLITNYLTRLRFCDINGGMEFANKHEADLPPDGYFPWFRVPNRKNQDLKIIFGHWAALNGQTDVAQTYALDTGCVWGNCLSAMRLEDGKRFSTPCQPYQAIVNNN